MLTINIEAELQWIRNETDKLLTVVLTENVSLLVPTVDILLPYLATRHMVKKANIITYCNDCVFAYYGWNKTKWQLYVGLVLNHQRDLNFAASTFRIDFAALFYFFISR